MQATQSSITPIPMIPLPSVQKPVQPAQPAIVRTGLEEAILRIKKKAQETLGKTPPSANKGKARNGLHDIVWQCEQAEKQFDQSQIPPQTDIKISVAGKSFSLHSAIVKCHSPLLLDACKSSQAISLTPEVARTIFAFFYTGKLDLTSDNFMDVLEAAKTWQIESIESECLNSLESTPNARLFWTFWKKSFDNEKYSQFRPLLLEWATVCTLELFTCQRGLSCSFEVVKELLSKAPKQCLEEEKKNFVYAYHAKHKLDQSRLDELLNVTIVKVL